MSEKIKAFQKIFSIGFSKSGKTDKEKIFPAKVTRDPKTGEFKVQKEKLPTMMQFFWDYFIQKCHTNEENLQHRFSRYRDMDQAFYNSGLIGRSIKLVADEVVQSDTNRQPLMVEAPKKQKDFILELFEKTNIYSLLKSTAMNVIKYGDAGWGLSLSNKGVEEILPVKVFNITDRIEFTPQEVAEQLRINNSQLSNLSSMFRVNQLIKSIQETENYASYLKSYLFGFQIGELVMPPWRFLHFRNFTTESPFFPFGMPLFVNSLAPYSQYDAAMTLQIAARGANFPREVLKIFMPNVSNPTEKMDFLAEFINMIENIGISKVEKESQGVGERIYTLDGVYEYQLEDPRIELGKMEDADMLREDIIASLGIPRNYIDPSDGGFGDSGVALAQKFKPFARMVFSIQQALMEQISQMCKIHMIQSNEFKLEDIDFRLSMPYPEEMADSEALRTQSDQIRLAQDLLQTLSDQFLAGDAMPDEVSKDILMKILPYDDVAMAKWFKDIKKHKKTLDDDADGYLDKDEQLESTNQSWIKLENKMGKTKLREVIEEKVFNFKQKNMKEGVMHGEHYYSSKNRNRDFDPGFLREAKRMSLTELKGKSNERRDRTEEIKYVFNKEKKKKKK